MRVGTGANYINDLIVEKLGQRGIRVKSFYPRTPLLDSPYHLRGLKNILFFYSLLEHKDEILKCDLIQGTTYTPLTFLPFEIPVVAHFGSTSRGFLEATPLTNDLDGVGRKIYHELRGNGVIDHLNIKSRRPLRDIAEIEEYTATKAEAVIATSGNVMGELLRCGANKSKVKIIYNAIEDYWFDLPELTYVKSPHIFFLGRLGDDVFNFKLKGLDRLIDVCREFSGVQKTIITITTNVKIINWLKETLLNVRLFTNIIKIDLSSIMRPCAGGVLFIPSRYEGFSLSLIEGMSQGLVPVAYPVGVVPEIIQDGENGFIVRDQDAAKNRIRELVENKILREKMSLKAVETAQLFRADRIIDKWVALYMSLIK